MRIPAMVSAVSKTGPHISRFLSLSSVKAPCECADATSLNQTIRSEVLPLPPAFIDWLRTDGVTLPVSSLPGALRPPRRRDDESDDDDVEVRPRGPARGRERLASNHSQAPRRTRIPRAAGQNGLREETACE